MNLVLVTFSVFSSETGVINYTPTLAQNQLSVICLRETHLLYHMQTLNISQNSIYCVSIICCKSWISIIV